MEDIQEAGWIRNVYVVTIIHLRYESSLRRKDRVEEDGSKLGHQKFAYQANNTAQR